jgi:hypothetical protein
MDIWLVQADQKVPGKILAPMGMAADHQIHTQRVGFENTFGLVGKHDSWRGQWRSPKGLSRIRPMTGDHPAGPVIGYSGQHNVGVFLFNDAVFIDQGNKAQALNSVEPCMDARIIVMIPCYKVLPKRGRQI